MECQAGQMFKGKVHIIWILNAYHLILKDKVFNVNCKSFDSKANDLPKKGIDYARVTLFLFWKYGDNSKNENFLL